MAEHSKKPTSRYFAFVALLIGCFTANAQVTGLSFRPVDAAYSLSLDRMILLSVNPNTLHIYNPLTQTDQTVSLPAVPQNVSLSPDGTHAAVGFANAVVYVDLKGATITNTFSNVSVGTGQVICGSGYIYVSPTYDGSFISIDIGNGQTTTSNPYSYATGGTFDAAVNAVYSTQNGTSPNSMNRFDTSAGPLGSATSQPAAYFSVFHVCGPLWLSHDGSTIYSACGPVYRASTDPTKDMRYLGVLPQSSTSQSLSTSDSLNEIAVIPAVQPYSQPPAPNADSVVNLYSASSFTSIGQFATTPFQVNSTSFPAHGRWVFFNSSSSNLFIITQADASAGLQQDYAIENVSLAQSNSCNATFSTASASAIAAGSYETAQILSGEDCAFTAVSNAPWISLASGYYGSGNSTLTYLVRPNLSASPRSGTITMGSQTFTVTQEAAGLASALVPLSFKPVSAAYDKPLDKIIIVSASPNELHVYDPVSQADQVIPLTYLPLSLSVRPDGLTAAVGHSGKISIVDLQAFTVSQVTSVDMDAGGIALASNGYAYAFPSETNSFAPINSIQLSTGTLTALDDLYYGNIPRVDLSGNYLYVGSLSEGSAKFDISTGPAALVSELPQPFTGNLWLSENGTRLITSGGKVLFTSPNPTQDFQPDGQLATAGSIKWVADSQLQQQLAVLSDPGAPFQTPASSQLQIFASDGLQLKDQTSMPGFLNNGTTYLSHGKYLFWNAAASKLFAVTQADSSSGLLSDFAVFTVAAPESIPSCTYAVSPSTLNVPATASSWTFNVTSNCSWTAASSTSWVQTEYNDTNAGNGSFTIYFLSNPGAVRSGSITVGNQTVTVVQASSSCTYSLSASSESFFASGGTGSVNLITGANCPWSLQSNSAGLTVTSSSAGIGPATVQFSVAPLTSPASYQTSSLNIAGVLFNVSQIPGPATNLVVSPSELDFGSANVLTPSIAQTIVISNPTAQAISIGTLNLTGPNANAFSFWTDCGTSVAPGGSCSIYLRFTPLLVGSASAALHIPVGTVGTQISVLLLGTGQLSGSFEIVSMPTGKVLEVPSGSNSDGALIAQNSLNGSKQQQWQFVSTGDGYYVIKNVLTGKVLDVIGESTDNGTLIQQWDGLQGTNQQWQLVPVDDVHYSIVNRNSGKALDVSGASTSNGAQIQQWAYLDDPQQRWALVPAKSYHISNTLSALALDVAGASTSSGALSQQSSPNGSLEQEWQFIPVGGQYYAITNVNSGKVLDVIGASTNPGALVQQWDYLQVANQQWQILPLDGTNFKIVNRQSAEALDDAGYSTTAGTHIQQWNYLGATNQQWQISPVTYYNIINRNSGLVLDVAGGSTADGTNIQQWALNSFEQQQWQVVQAANGNYSITNRLSNKVLDVANSSTALGAAITQNASSAATSQQWQLIPVNGSNYYEIKNVNSGDALDVTGLSLANGALLQQWNYLAGENQEWLFVPVIF